MPKPPVGTRVLVEFGFGQKFMLPAGTSSDQISILVNAIKVNELYSTRGNNLHPIHNSESITIKIISSEDIKTFLDTRGENSHRDYDIIVQEVREAVKGHPHGVIMFNNKTMEIAGEEIEYEDLANPKVDPEEIIEHITRKALENPMEV